MTEPARFVWTITLGDLGVICAAATPLIGVVVWLARIERKLNYFLVEHEMLIADFAERRGVEPKDLPTRRKADW